EPISVQLAKQHLRVEIPDDDLLISTYITAARDDLEDEYEIAIVTQVWDYLLDGFPGPQLMPWSTSWQLGRGSVIEIPKPPLQTVATVTYTDTTGAATVWP